jgi:hypothetical protein
MFRDAVRRRKVKEPASEKSVRASKSKPTGKVPDISLEIEISWLT